MQDQTFGPLVVVVAAAAAAMVVVVVDTSFIEAVLINKLGHLHYKGENKMAQKLSKMNI
jgi:hypothetical protein